VAFGVYALVVVVKSAISAAGGPVQLSEAGCINQSCTATRLTPTVVDLSAAASAPQQHQQRQRCYYL